MAGSSWTNQVQNQVLVGGSPGSGVFVYDPTVGAGNLIASLTDAAADPFADVTEKGVTAYVVIGGTRTAINLNQQVALGLAGLGIFNVASVPFSAAGLYGFSNAIAAAQALVWSGQSTGADVAAYLKVESQLLAGVPNGIAQLVAGNVILGSSSGLVVNDDAATLQLGATPTLIIDDTAGTVTWHKALLADPAAPGNGFSLYAAATSAPAAITTSGIKGGIPLVQTDNSIITVTAASITAITVHWSIPDSDIAVGTVYRQKAFGLGTQGSTQQNLSVDGNNGNPTILMSGTEIPISTTFSWWAEAELRVTATGAGGTADVKVTFGWQANATSTQSNSGTGVQVAHNVAFDTTIAQTAQIRMKWASTTGAPTITCYGSTFERLGP